MSKAALPLLDARQLLDALRMRGYNVELHTDAIEVVGIEPVDQARLRRCRELKPALLRILSNEQPPW